MKLTKRLLTSALALVLVVTSLILTPPNQATAATTTGKVTDEFNIVTFWPYHWENELTPEYFDTIKESGITTVEMNSSMNADVLTYENNLKAIQLAYERGLNVTVSEKDYNNSTWPEKTDAEIEAFVNRYKNVPGVTGIYIEDEDGNAKRYAKAIAKIKSMMPNVITHVNFCNDYANNFKGLYNELAKYGTGLMDYIMYDKYTFITPICDEQTLYYMLEYTRKLGEEYNLPTANYVQSMEINGGYRPNGSDIRYQVWAGLAYGLKQYSYFCYHTPPNTHETFGPAILDMDGNKTDLYDPVKELNWDVRTIGDTLMKLNTKVVYHTGTSFGDAYNALPSTHYLQPVDKNQNLTISRMQHQNGQEYGILVSRDYNYDQTVQFTLGNGMKSIHLISTETGKPVALSPDVNGVYSVDLKPGEGFLFKVGANSDFSYLSNILDYANTINLNNYKSTGKDAFITALANANSVAENTESTQTQINSAFSTLQNALGALKLNASDGENLALNSTVTATSSYEEGTKFKKEFLTDGVYSSSNLTSKLGWSVNPSDKLAKNKSVDIVVQLKDKYWIEGVVLRPTLHDNGKSFPLEYTISVSTNNEKWTTVSEVSGVKLSSALDQHYEVDGIKAQYVRIRITGHSDVIDSECYMSAIGEIEVYGADVVAFGDINGTGGITAEDARLVLQAFVGKISFTTEQNLKADVDGNGKIDAGDALDILKRSVGKIKKFAVDR